jgi:predicted DNA helicase
LADARRLEAQAVDQVLDGTSVVGATLTGLDPNVLGARRFDLAVIDEAAQATEPASWIPIGRCERLVLAGDHCQLPPTVVSSNAARCGLAMSLMERLQPILGSAVFRRLNVQYRMHAQIMDFSNEEFYGGTLVAAEAVAGRLLCDLPGVAVAESTRRVMELIDSAGAGFDEVEEPDGESRLNPSEAEVVCRLADQFVSMGVPPSDVAVISPYAAQVRLLRERLSDPRIEVDSVDGFQGREKEVVLISLVRSNREGQIGFLSDHRRMNVAITRARCRLVLVGDSATLASDPFYGRLLEYVERRGTYRTAWET